MKAREKFQVRLWFCGFVLAQFVGLWQAYGEWLVRAVAPHG
jgi:hypothetical protein